MKAYKPTSPGQRGRITTSRKMLWPGRPLKALTVGLKKTGGRNNAGGLRCGTGAADINVCTG